MKISLKACLFLTLVFVCVFASWQGVGAGYAISTSRGSAADVLNRHIGELSRITTIKETEETGSLTFYSDESSGLPDSAIQSQSSPGSPDLKSWWALRKIHALPLPGSVGNTPPVPVAVLDTGIDKNHEDLYGKVAAEINFSTSHTADDVYGHGTPVAGIIAADVENGLGMAGLASQVRLLNVKVADDKGKCRLSTLVAGIIWAVDHGARVINISIELQESTPELKNAVDYAWNNGAVIIAAAGNDGNSQPVYPASYENCLAVTALQESEDLVPLANYGDWVDVAAPGLDIYSTLPGNNYGYKHGTSFATAYVSGLAALLFSMAIDTNGDGRLNDEVRRAIEVGCDAIDIEGAGKGCINVASSIATLSVKPGI